ncbi:chloramphenicol acetyltransferase [Donghicola sp. C2-DW-16]|uniref:Chloramphenicol acetyltransferase n=1 Tax=Donghicola mangrovi TaxID=2729614 RepID=A0ABX2PCP6_9RHOB|nr:chloramphenicol acetyltransferase [Donghicola mangrovi]NVO27252.1 chloramphenicol acetyltransferase [Donghicola mangrovi]
MPKLSPTDPYIHPECSIAGSTFGAYVEIGHGSRVLNSTFEDYAYCDRYADIANTTVGRFSNIAAFTRIGPTDHPYRKAAQHHFLYRSSYYFEDAEDDPRFFEHRASRRSTLGADCWVGHGAIIKPEVTIGTGAVIASGAVVTRDVAPFMIMAGVPAKPVKMRFDPSVADALQEIAWWDWPHDRLRTALEDFRTMRAEAFVEKYR